MKLLLLTSVFICCAATSFSQDCTIATSGSAVQYLQQKSGGPATVIRNVPVKITYWIAAGGTAADMKLTFSLNKKTATGNPTLLNASYSIPKSEIGTAHATKVIDLSVQISATTTAGGTFEITVANSTGTATGMKSVDITDKDPTIEDQTKYDDLKPFWIELGTNLDLVDGPKPNNFTAGIFYHKFDHRWGENGRTHWASFAGAYESKIVSNVNNSLRFGTDSFTNNRSFIPGVKDSIKIFYYAGKPKQIQTIRNWSFFYSPAYRLGGGEYDDGNFHIYASLWAELRYQEVQTTTDNSSLLLIDSSRVPIRTIGNYKQSDDTIVKSGVYTHFLGFGFPIYTESKGPKGFSFLLNPVIGATNQPTGESYAALGTDKSANIPGNPRWHPFYFVQFRLSDKEFGLTVTGEVRGLLIEHSPPQYTIALTKKFNLKKLIFYNSNSSE